MRTCMAVSSVVLPLLSRGLASPVVLNASLSKGKEWRWRL